MGTTVIQTYTFEDWVNDNGGRSNAYETKDEDGKLLLLFMTGATAKPIAAGTYIAKYERDAFFVLADKAGQCWKCEDSPGASGSLLELEAAAKNADIALNATRREFDRRKEYLSFYGSHGAIVLTDQDERELLDLKEKADHYNAVVKQIAELIAAHPEKLARDERSRQAMEYKAALDLEARAARMAAERRIGSIQLDR